MSFSEDTAMAEVLDPELAEDLFPENTEFNELMYNTGVGFALVACSSTIVMFGASVASIVRAAGNKAINANLFSTVFSVIAMVLAYYALDPYFSAVKDASYLEETDTWSITAIVMVSLSTSITMFGGFMAQDQVSIFQNFIGNIFNSFIPGAYN